MAAAVWVGVNPERTTALMEPFVEEAVELKDVAAVLYQDVETFNWRASADEAMTLYLAALRMPSMMFDRLEGRLAEVRQKLRTASGGKGPLVVSKKVGAGEAFSALQNLQPPQSLSGR